MRCKKCREKIELYDIYCHDCGQDTGLIKKELLAKSNFAEVSKGYSDRFSSYLPLSILIFFSQVLPMLGLVFWFKYNPIFENYLLNYSFAHLILLVFLPFMLLPFNLKDFTISSYFQKFNQLPKYVLFSLFNFLYYVLLRLICTGDPILNLVWLIMVFYWLAVNVPTIYLISQKDMPVFKAIILAYKAGKETRWQQFFTIFRLLIIDLIGLALAGVGVIFVIPLNYQTILNYGAKLDKLTLFENIQ